MRFSNEFSLLKKSIQKEYVNYRKTGKNRAEAIEMICTEYSEEMEDEDDRLPILVGIADALCEKKELIEEVSNQIFAECNRISCDSSISRAEITYLNNIENRLKQGIWYGQEAAYRKRKRYKPEWEIGDVFYHELTYPTSKELGIYGWFILIYKIGEYIDQSDDCNQLVYVTVCPPEKNS